MKTNRLATVGATDLVSNSKSAGAVGFVEGVFHGCLSGWFYDPNDPNVTDLQLVVNDTKIIPITANIPRPDVEEGLGIDKNCGFCFDLLSLDETETIEVSVRHKSKRYEFFDQKFLFSRKVAGYADRLEQLFFPEFYRKRYELAHLNNDAAFKYYLSVGIYKDHDPSPWFDNKYYCEKYDSDTISEYLPIIDYLMWEDACANTATLDPGVRTNVKPSRLFDTQYYVEANPDLKGMRDLLAHYTNHGSREGRKCVERIVSAHIKKELEAYHDIEPALKSVSDKIGNVVRYPILSGSTYVPGLAKDRFDDKIKVIVCVPFISVGGADLVATRLIEAYKKEYSAESVLLLATNCAEIEVGSWVSENTNVFFLDGESEYESREDKVDTLHRTIACLAPEKVVNVNSHECWELFKVYGNQLSSVIDLYAYIFCFDHDIHGHRVGYISSYIPDLLDNLKSVFCDNQKIISDMKVMY